MEIFHILIFIFIVIMFLDTIINGTAVVNFILHYLLPIHRNMIDIYIYMENILYIIYH